MPTSGCCGRSGCARHRLPSLLTARSHLISTFICFLCFGLSFVLATHQQFTNRGTICGDFLIDFPGHYPAETFLLVRKLSICEIPIADWPLWGCGARGCALATTAPGQPSQLAQPPMLFIRSLGSRYHWVIGHSLDMSMKCPDKLVMLPPFHGGNRGSNPLGRASFPLFIPAMRSCRASHALFNIQITGRMIP